MRSRSETDKDYQEPGGRTDASRTASLVSTREAYGRTLLALGRENRDIVVLDADLAGSTKTGLFSAEFPERHFQMGIAEANMIGTAAGLASCGKIPFASTFAVFATCRAFDQLRMSVAYPCLNVKVVATHGGITVGEDGASHHAIEDVALACALPDFVVIVVADAKETEQAIRAVAQHVGPVYVRLSRPSVPVIYQDRCDFVIGRAIRLLEGKDLTIVANGLMVSRALEAASLLSREGVSARVLDMHTVKPLDKEAVRMAAADTGAIVAAEEHLLQGGLGTAVAQAVAESRPVPMRFVAIRDQYARSGKPDQLLEMYGLTSQNIVQAAREVVQEK
ncbi:MAG TPA: transketolase family protein [Chloroflexi bacterium]|nr:transketolase family protein [Chloroflexota bacterium]